VNQCTKHIQDHNENKLHILDNKDLTFSDKEKGDKLLKIFHKRCVDIVEN
jgi:hypothetical protein